ncbi:MAG: DinB family protein [Pirellulales bacterium]
MSRYELQLHDFTMFYLRLLMEGIEDDQLAIQPAPGLNHPAWILGHLAAAADFVPKLLREKTLCPDAWNELFRPGSTPTTDRSRYPSKAELMEINERAYVRNKQLIAAATPEQLAAPQPIEYFRAVYPTIGSMLAHLIATHPAFHLGQLSTWRRLMGMKGVMAFP